MFFLSLQSALRLNSLGQNNENPLTSAGLYPFWALGSDPKGLTSYRRKGECLDIPTLALLKTLNELSQTQNELFGQRAQREQSPVEHSWTYVRHPFIRSSPLALSVLTLSLSGLKSAL